jgi:hypothetical protein
MEGRSVPSSIQDEGEVSTRIAWWRGSCTSHSDGRSVTRMRGAPTPLPGRGGRRYNTNQPESHRTILLWVRTWDSGGWFLEEMGTGSGGWFLDVRYWGSALM